MVGVKRRTSAAERLDRKLDKSSGPGGCWIWSGYVKDRYGQIPVQIDGNFRYRAVHAVAWAAHNKRPLPSGRLVHQTCGNRMCCQPKHLYYGEYAKRSLADRFNEKVDRSGGPDACWPWTGTLVNGYGQIGYYEGRRLIKKGAHVVAWALANDEEIPAGNARVVRHSCDNPPCVNPAHLLIGTSQQNSQDGVARGRIRGRRKLTDDQVRELRRLREAGTTLAELSERFSLGRDSVSMAARRLTYRDVK